MFILVCRYNRVFAYPGDDITLTVHLSPETSAVGMEIRWFRGIECIYLYKNGQVTVGRGYEGRLSLFNEELQRGNVSLLLRDVGQADTGIYSCQVITGENRENRVEKTIHLYMAGTEILSPERLGLKIAEQDSLDMEESVHSLEMKKLLQKKDKELQDKIKELESATEEFRRMTCLLQDRETDLDNMRKVANDGKVSLKNMAGELEACKRELEKLGLKLQEKDSESKVMLEELQARTRAVQVLTVTLQEKERELEEERKQQEEREQLLQTVAVNEGGPGAANVPEEPVVSELVEKSEEMLSEMYQDPKDQLEDIERWIHKKREERRTREEEESTEALEKEFLSYVMMIKGQIEEEHEKIVTLAKYIADLQEAFEHVATDEERGELEVYLKEAVERQREGEGEIERLTKEIDKQRNAVEEKHKHEVEQIREKYEVVSRIEAETNLLKIILPDVQAYFRNITAEVHRAFTKQLQAMDREKGLEAGGEREREPDRVKNSVREKMQEDRMSPIEEESSNDMLEVSEQRMEAEQARHIEDGLENDSYVETLTQGTKADTRLRREINGEFQTSESTDSESETLELEEHPNMVNGVMTLRQEEVQVEIGVREHDEERNEVDMGYSQ
ncbi:golgin subfamily A member 6-like protein 22 [Colossoma macropomum]|uniref:golgin subfamily A member 6-like protein 22 n=1 Tax=Colossoma macropomum TaxID=42526 RepID=UPI00186462B4|nr:golgin subfamily A member 6-like protein 22 [Colossoma macropomum]